MKLNIAAILIALCLSIALSCNGPQVEDTVSEKPVFVAGSGWMVQDSQRVNSIRVLRDSLDSTLGKGDYTSVSLAPDFIGIGDDLTYFTKNDSIIAMSYAFYSDDLVVRLMYILQDDQLTWAQTRVWNRTGVQPDATQVQFYLDNDTIFYVTEKYVELKEGEPPTKMGMMDSTPSQRDRDTLIAELSKYWDPIYQLVVNNNNQ